MNYHNYIFYDFETGGKKCHESQPIQLAAVAIDGRKLTMHKHGTFDTLIQPVFDEKECQALGIEPLQDDALTINRKTREQLKDAPSPKEAWENFDTFVQRYSIRKGGAWDRPIPVGFNSNNFDETFVRRLCKEHGPYDEEYQSQKIFHPIHKQDLMAILFQWTEDLKGFQKLNMDTIRKVFGMTENSKHLKPFKKDGKELYTHDALRDVLDGGELFCRFMKMTRRHAHKTKFEGSCK